MNNVRQLIDSIEKFAACREFLTFALGDEEFAVDMQLVREIRNYGQVTEIANAPDCIKGVMDLRGNLVPVLDLRLKLRGSDPVYTSCTVVIILAIEDREVGLVVDSVSDVIQLKSHQIKNARMPGTKHNGIYTSGLGRIDNRMMVLIDINYLIAEANFESIEVMAA